MEVTEIWQAQPYTMKAYMLMEPAVETTYRHVRYCVHVFPGLDEFYST